MRRRAVAALLAMLAGCASPNPELYTLAALPGPAIHIAARSVELRRIGLAGYLDRPEIVRSAAQYRLLLSDNQRWGEPLGGMLDRVFTEDLVQRLPGTAVFAEDGAISTTPDLVLEIDVERLDADASGVVVLLAQVAIRHGDAGHAAQARTLRLTATPASAAMRDYVAAVSRTLAGFADQVAGSLDQADRPPGAG
jgi:uncharacterized lipoprotein YmbA